MPGDHPWKDKAEDGIPTRPRSRLTLPTLFAECGQLRIRLALPTGDGKNMGRFPQRLSMKIFKRVIRVHQFLEPPIHWKGDRLDRSIENLLRLLIVQRCDLLRRNQLGGIVINLEFRRLLSFVCGERENFGLVKCLTIKSTSSSATLV